MKHNPLLKLQSLGQSIWLDHLGRGLLASGELRRLLQEDGVRGVTSNPAIFEKAIAGTSDYDKAILTLSVQGKSAMDIYHALTLEDIQRTADLLRPVYNATNGRDGFVSLEVSPHLAHDTGGTVAEARRLWAALGRPNVLIKVPATSAGLPAIRQLLSEGINVNVTLLFGLARYREVTEVYVSALRLRAAQGLPLEVVSSVASFFLSRIDVLVDSLLEKVIQLGGARREVAASLRGQAAVASAKMAFQVFKRTFSSGSFRELIAKGGRSQHLVWASTGTKNPAYADIKYVEGLIGSETINTLPLETLQAYRDHGQPAARLEEDIDEAAATLTRLLDVGIDLEHVAMKLEDEAVRKFIVPFDQLMAALEQKRCAALEALPNCQAIDRTSPEIPGRSSAAKAR